MKWQVKDLSIEDLKKKIKEELKADMAYRKDMFEDQWAINEAAIYPDNVRNIKNGTDESGHMVDMPTSIAARRQESTSSVSMETCYAMKYARYLLAQASANPPSCIPTPKTADYGDRKGALAADGFLTYGRKKTITQEIQDRRMLGTFTYGTGFSKTFFNKKLGDIKTDKENETVETFGDIDSYSPSTWNVWLDAKAKCEEDIEHFFEKTTKSSDECCSRWPEFEDRFYADNKKENEVNQLYKKHTKEIWEYWLRGDPWNGFAGCMAYFLFENDEVTILESDVNPFPGARLPYRIQGDIDEPAQVYCRSVIDYIAPLQLLLNFLDTTVTQQAEVHGSAKLVIWGGMKLANEAIDNSFTKVLEVSGYANGVTPQYIKPASLLQHIPYIRDRVLQGMEALAGLSESSFGQVNREMSGFASQTAINSANLTRRRFFVKYQKVTEDTCNDYLELVQMHYKEKKQLKIIGKEDAFTIGYFNGADIEGKYDFTSEYGTALSLDPASRREEIMLMMPLLEKAKVSPKQILGYLRMSDSKNAIDIAERARTRQFEIFDEMEATYMLTEELNQIEPEKNEEHADMLEACREYRVSAQFKTLPPDLKKLIDEHYDLRLAAASALSAQPADTTGGAGAMAGVLPPTLGLPAVPPQV